jgi:hypothetical protein
MTRFSRRSRYKARAAIKLATFELEKAELAAYAAVAEVNRTSRSLKEKIEQTRDASTPNRSPVVWGAGCGYSLPPAPVLAL